MINDYDMTLYLGKINNSARLAFFYLPLLEGGWAPMLSTAPHYLHTAQPTSIELDIFLKAMVSLINGHRGSHLVSVFYNQCSTQFH